MRGAIVISLFAAAAGAYAAGPESENEIRKLDQQWAASVSSRDTAALEKLFAPELIYAHSTGAVEDKSTYIGRLKAGKQRYDSIQIENSRVIPYGDSVVSHSFVRMKGTNEKGPFNDHVMMMHFWVRQSGAWHLVAHQTTKIP